MSHTPGPWKLEEHTYSALIPMDPKCPEGGSYGAYGGNIANARLIAAAPDLLEALADNLAASEWLAEQYDVPEGVCDFPCGEMICDQAGCVRHKVNSAQAAIAKARP